MYFVAIKLHAGCSCDLRPDQGLMSVKAYPEDRGNRANGLWGLETCWLGRQTRPIMMTDPHALLSYLDELGIAHETTWHEPLFTVEDGLDLKASLPGAHSKNLLLKDKTGALVLVSAEAQSKLRLNQLHKVLGTKRLSFASADSLAETLGVVPGSVTGFALINDKSGRVRFVMEKTLADAAEVNFHPLLNTGTTRVSQSDFRRFVAATDHTLDIVDFSAFVES